MESNPTVVKAEAAVDASVAAFTAVLAGGDAAVSGTHGGPDPVGGSDAAVEFIDDPLQQVADRALDVLAGLARSEAKLAALKAQAVEVFAAATSLLNAPASSPHEATAQNRSLVAEVGCALAIGDRAADALLAESHALTTALPRTLAALQGGSISWQHARVMVDEAATLDPDGPAALEAHFLDPDTPRPATAATIGEMPAYRFRRKARTWRERHHPESIEKRHAKGVADRRVEYRPDQDGMAWLSAYLPADQAMAGWNRLNALARGMQGTDEHRTLTQIRADEFSSAILASGTNGGTSSGSSSDSSSVGAGNSAGSGDAASSGYGDGAGNGFTGASTGAGAVAGTDPTPSSSIRAQVLVTVPVFALMGLTDEPAMLDGYGPIPPSMARGLVANSADSFHRVLVDPRDGAPLEIGRTSYRVTKAMRNWLRMRDGKCPFPGCSNHSLDNEADHVLAWQHGGTTGISNLGQPCPRHHRLRHTSGWRPTPATKNEPPGWTSPTGRHYKSEHQDWELPRWPDSVLSSDVKMPDDLAEAWPQPQDLSQRRLSPADRSYIRLSPDDLTVEGLFLHDEFPEDTFDDWFLPGYQRPKDPVPEDIWWELACEGSRAAT